jgi:hypothetical protein
MAILHNYDTLTKTRQHCNPRLRLPNRLVCRLQQTDLVGREMMRQMRFTGVSQQRDRVFTSLNTYSFVLLIGSGNGLFLCNNMAGRFGKRISSIRYNISLCTIQRFIQEYNRWLVQEQGEIRTICSGKAV